MLFGHVRKFPNIKKPIEKYCLGQGHICFFKDKLSYLEKRHSLIKKEMVNRGFKTNKEISLNGFSKELRKDWKPSLKDKEIIKKRIIYKINLKPSYYRYYKEKKNENFFLELIKKAN
jgi:deoxyribonuclease (pyrimidine dimer)